MTPTNAQIIRLYFCNVNAAAHVTWNPAIFSSVRLPDFITSPDYGLGDFIIFFLFLCARVTTRTVMSRSSGLVFHLFIFISIFVVGYGLRAWQSDRSQVLSSTESVSSTSIASVSPSSGVLSVTSIATSTTFGLATSTNAIVVSVVDGDTIEAREDGKETVEKIRLLGVNTPETVDPRRPVECFGKEASSFTKKLMEGKRIRLASDPEADEVDKYDRLLRNIILEDGTDVNALLVREGYAYAYVSFPQNRARKAELKKLQEDAKLHARGLWNPTTCNGQK